MHVNVDQVFSTHPMGPIESGRGEPNGLNGLSFKDLGCEEGLFKLTVLG